MSTHNDRARALGRELIETHNWLRAELRRVSKELDQHAGGATLPPRDLRAHCLTFCQAVTDHHTGEDQTVFPVLAQQFPDLAPVLTELAADHRLVADILARMTELLTDASTDNLVAVRNEVSGLSAILESHFQWEERRITTALDELPATHHPGIEGLRSDLR
ncbi:hemerythrin domain-containing protein [Nocardia heshunensis]